MVNFTSIPAFGFETASCNAEEFYNETNIKGFEYIGKPEHMEMVYKNLSNAAKKAWKTSNVVKALGYIPLIGTLIGIDRISKAAKCNKDVLPNKFNHIARGCVELFSLGFLLLLPDIILTGYRSYHSAKTSSSVLGRVIN